jgi:hypothetical protein
MELIFGGYVLVSGVIIAYLVWAVLEAVDKGREDVDKLEKRMLMMTRPEALAADSLGDDEPPGEIHYMDDERMAELDKAR